MVNLSSKVDTFLKSVRSQTKNLLRRIFCLLREEFEGEKHEKSAIFHAFLPELPLAKSLFTFEKRLFANFGNEILYFQFMSTFEAYLSDKFIYSLDIRTESPKANKQRT